MLENELPILITANNCIFIQYLYLNYDETVHQRAGWPGFSLRDWLF